VTTAAPAGYGVNFVPLRYRGVAVSRVDVPLEEGALRELLTGRPAYMRTRFVGARGRAGTAIVRITRAETEPVLSPITDVELLAGPDECADVHAPEADTGIPSALASAAVRLAPGYRFVVVEGRYAHVNFIIDPRPIRITVREVVPPLPAKLADQARRIIAVTEDLPPMEIVEDLVWLDALATERPSPHYLLPCRGSGGEVPGATVSYLDEHPERADWTLLGCDRSLQIHRGFYGDEPPTVDFCPKKAVLAAGSPGPALTKCCLQEEHVESGEGWVTVPWGASLDHVRDALRRIADREAPSWAPG
jgi:hypothetical protein